MISRGTDFLFMTDAGSHHCQTGDPSPRTGSNIFNNKRCDECSLPSLRDWNVLCWPLGCTTTVLALIRAPFIMNGWLFYCLIYALSYSGSLRMGWHEFVKMQRSETCPNLIDKSRINYSARWTSLWILFIWRLYYSLVLGNNRCRRSGDELGSSQVCNRAYRKLPYR